MATWQTTFYLVPRESVESNLTEWPMVIDQDTFHSIAWWAENGKVENLLKAIDFLPSASSWSPNIKIWGDVESEDLTCYFKNGYLSEIRLRFDLRKDNTLLIKIVELAKTFELVFISESGRLIPANYKLILREMKSSPAAKFVRNPQKFLDDLDNADH